MKPELVRGKRKKKVGSPDLEPEDSESEDTDMEETTEQINTGMSDSTQTEGLLLAITTYIIINWQGRNSKLAPTAS